MLFLTYQLLHATHRLPRPALPPSPSLSFNVNVGSQLKASMPPGVPTSGHTNIFTLGQTFVKDTDSVLTVELCSRIALMVRFYCWVCSLAQHMSQRQEYTAYPGDNFWDKLDERLVWMREAANYDEKKITKYVFLQVIFQYISANNFSSVGCSRRSLTTTGLGTANPLTTNSPRTRLLTAGSFRSTSQSKLTRLPSSLLQFRPVYINIYHSFFSN